MLNSPKRGVAGDVAGDAEHAERGADSNPDPRDHRSPAERAASAERRRTGRDPTLPPNHPVNALSPLRKLLIVVSLAYAGCLCNFSIAIANVAFPLVAKTLHVAPGDIANALGYNLLGAAVGSLIWNPLSQCIGRRPVYLIGSFLFMPVCVWQALSNNYPCFVVGRIFAGLVTSWSQTLPPTSIADIYVLEVRGAKMSAYAVPTVLGPVIAPIFAAAIVNKHSWRNLWHFNLGLAGLQFLLVLFCCPETMWNEADEHNEEHGHLTVSEKADSHTVTHSEGSEGRHSEGNHTSGDIAKPDAHHIEGRLGDVQGTHNPIAQDYPTENGPRTPECHVPRPGHVGVLFWPHHDWKRFWPLMLSPFQMFFYLTISLPSFYYGFCLGFLSIGVTIVFPQVFDKPPYSFAVVPLGAAYLAFGIGGVIGMWSGGHLSDVIVSFWERRRGTHRQPEDRLWAGYLQFPLMFLGLLLCGLGIQLQLHWMCFLMGGAITFFSLSGITTVIVTYTLESYISRGMDTQAVFSFWKYIWGFVVPFFIMKWGERSGWIVCFVGQGIILLVGGALLFSLLIWKGYDIRKAQGMPLIPKH